ncbi:peptidase [Nitrosarchaeum sp.]|uniref:peptidase n=1 Tax=Nitrosarchaeum sp. TaxID=2026886 RepID=UPI00247B7A6E|nr:peptidase [Nitrosarchaeum sp.]MCV0412191.1 peptidase [Nitrosarchaeum sp.]
MSKLVMKHAYFGLIMILVVISSIPSQNVSGHGLGGETHPPVTLDGRDVTLSINISPSTFDLNDLERYITINLNESKSQGVVEHVTLMFELKKDGERIFRRMFHDDLGNLTIKVINDGSDEIKIKGDLSPALESWMRTATEPVTMTGSVFNSGGLYEYKIEILTADSDFNFLDKRLELIGAISLAEHNTYTVVDSEQASHIVNIISYFDKIENFEFNSNKISFSMPFDWNQDLEQISVVHQEVRIPEGFSEFLHTKYDVKINNIVIKDDAVTIDDYSSDGRTVHVVMNQEDLKQIKEQAKQKSDSDMYFELGLSNDVVLPLVATTPDIRYQAYLSWKPEIIRAGEDITFFLETKELFTDKSTKNIEYEVDMSSNGTSIYHERIFGSVNSETLDKFQFKFLPEHIGTVKLDISDIGGNSLSDVNFLLVVKPQEITKFPITLESKSNTLDGQYLVDLTWFPNTLGLGESEFVMTFYEKDSKLPVRGATYDFVLLKDGSEIYRKSGIANAGGTFENFVFVEKETGDLTIRIENIAGTDEYVEIPINVTPEFPLGISIMFMIIISILMISTKYVKNFQYNV